MISHDLLSQKKVSGGKEGRRDKTNSRDASASKNYKVGEKIHQKEDVELSEVKRPKSCAIIIRKWKVSQTSARDL